MSQPIETLNPATLSAAREAGEWQLAQLNLRGSAPQKGFERSGLPKMGRVLVVIGYQGCATHDFAELERQAKMNKATLYVINGNSDEAGSDRKDYHPSISVSTRGEDGKPKFRPLDGIVITPKNAAGKPLTPKEVREIGSMLGFTLAAPTSGLETVSSIGAKLYENGQEVTVPKKAEYRDAPSAHSRG